MDRRLVLPDDPAIVRTFGAGLPDTLPDVREDETDEQRSARLARNRKRALRQRLRRAERAGLLPKRVFLSSQRFAYRSDELEAALAALPQAHVATLGRAPEPAP